MSNESEKEEFIDLFNGLKDSERASINRNNSSELTEALCYNACHHNSYKIYYPSASIVKNIIKSKSLIARCDDYEDKDEQINVENDDNDTHYKFILCFTFSQSESVAMWKLYAHDGCMVSYGSNTTLKGIIQSNNKKSIEVGHFDKTKSPEDSFEKKFEAKCTVELVDVLYKDKIKENKNHDNKEEVLNNYYIRRSTDHCSIKKSIVDDLPKYILKSNVWNHENECRLIVKVKKEDFKGHDIKDCSAVRIKLEDDIIKKIENNIYQSPFLEPSKNSQNDNVTIEDINIALTQTAKCDQKLLNKYTCKEIVHNFLKSIEAEISNKDAFKELKCKQSALSGKIN